MKLLITGDWHLRLKRPKNRKDKSYFQTQLNKVSQILDLSREHNCQYVLQPGDFFDGADTPFFVIRAYIGLLKDRVPIVCVRGQHDLRYHSTNVENTPLAVMEAAGSLTVVDSSYYLDQKTVVWGSGFEKDIPVPD